MSTIELAPDPTVLDEIPPREAVYAIFEKPFNIPDQLKCRYVGTASDLREAIATHFSVREPNVGLRYFMISRKEKYLTFIPTDGMKEEEVISEACHWRRTFKPDCCS